MTESGYSSATRLKPDGTLPPPDQLRRRRRRCCAAWTCCGLLVVVLAIVALALALTVFKTKDPKTTLVSVKVDGVASRLDFPAVRVELNVTLDLDLLVYNPNVASFAHAPGRTLITYRGTQVGDADVAPGRIPSRGSAHVYCRLTLQADQFAADPGSLLTDAISGEVGIDTATTIPGRVTFLGFIKRHVVTFSDCHVAIEFPNLRVREQQCRQKTKL